MPDRIAVVGLGYVGLRVALACARELQGTLGFDTNADRVRALREGIDRSGEVDREELLGSPLELTTRIGDLAPATFFIVAVPTPIDDLHRPDLGHVQRAAEDVGKVLKRGDVVVLESTVYPGTTEGVFGPALARASGLRQGSDFKLGYSPERINPGDREHTLATVRKIVAADDPETLSRLVSVYGRVAPAGLHHAPSIQVAEAAKVIENTQRDLNIALMNEIALICHRLGLRTSDVLEAAATKWNFLPFKPGLVGGHCVGVDPYYLTARAESVGYHPEVILAGRRINDGMGIYVAQRLVKMLAGARAKVAGAQVAILGATFKENVADVRNTRVADIVAELRQFGIEPLVHDPLADPEDASRALGTSLAPWHALRDLDALVLAVPHRLFMEMGPERLLGGLREGGMLVDVKSALDPAKLSRRLVYWSL